MTPGQENRSGDIPPPGDDEVPAPLPVTEEPPFDRFCDLVLTGGVASGVVYPWAIVELARAYRFRNIGGTSVGAMAAALAAAAEYGRRTGYEAPFETLRRLPAALGEDMGDGRTRMLSLFQTNVQGKRLIELWRRLGCGQRQAKPSLFTKVWSWLCGSNGKKADAGESGFAGRFVVELLRVYAGPCWLGALVGGALALLLCLCYVGLATAARIWVFLTLALLLAPIGALLALLWALWSDLKHGVVQNQLGLCKGGTLEPVGPDGKDRPGLSEWLHEGIQRSAGLKKADPPLTFRDLWNAPAYPGAAPRRCGEDDPVSQRSINLQVITTNVTHGRPYRLPLADQTSRLFFKLEELKDYFPASVLAALKDASDPYAPRLRSSNPKDGDREPPASKEAADLWQLPGADLPVVVAARLSLSFPLLFSAVPLWAIDYEAPKGERTLKRCQFTDGGVSSNFPVHLFDAALPRWPTFGLWLDRRTPYEHTEKDGRVQAVWLPEYHWEGWADNWNRFDPAAAIPPEKEELQKHSRAAGYLAGFLGAIATSALDWRDRTSFRLPHVRNRVARLLLRPGEGGLHIGMSREQILRMAHCYGTRAGQLFVERFADDQGRQASQAWSEQRWVRLELLINGLRERLDGLSAGADWAAHTVPMTEAIKQAVKAPGPIKDRGDCNKLSEEQKVSLDKLLTELELLEAALLAAKPQRFKPVPVPELRLRAPL